MKVPNIISVRSKLSAITPTASTQNKTEMCTVSSALLGLDEVAYG